MKILGLSALSPSPTAHDSTAIILEDGVIKAAVSEERFSRVKHDGGYPSSSIHFCLNHIGSRLSEIDQCYFLQSQN